MAVVEVDQTTPMISPSQAFPNPKSPVGVADGAVWLCCTDMNRYRLLPHLSKSPGLHLVLEIGTTKVHLLSKEGEVMENDGGNLYRQTGWIHFRILDPTDEDRYRGSLPKDAWNYPIHGIG